MVYYYHSHAMMLISVNALQHKYVHQSVLMLPLPLYYIPVVHGRYMPITCDGKI